MVLSVSAKRPRGTETTRYDRQRDNITRHYCDPSLLGTWLTRHGKQRVMMAAGTNQRHPIVDIYTAVISDTEPRDTLSDDKYKHVGRRSDPIGSKFGHPSLVVVSLAWQWFILTASGPSQGTDSFRQTAALARGN